MDTKKYLTSSEAVKLLVVTALAFLLTTACHNSITHNSDIPIANASNCQIVKYKLESVCIPVEPKRIVALDPGLVADPLLALGIRPIGITTYSILGKEDLAGLTSDDIEGIENVGDVFNPSLEKILKLKPDLILGISLQEAIYKQLSAIAPTVLLEDQKYAPIKKNLKYLAQILNKEVKAKKLLAQYQARIEELREELNSQPKEIEVTVLIRYSGSFLIPGTEHASHELFSDIGLIDNISDSANRQISIEVIDKYDADILFMMNYDEKSKSFLLQNPLIASLNAVKNNRVHFVEIYKWHPGGILGLNRMLDDISAKRYFQDLSKEN